LSGTNLSKKPEDNELEISVFGPGYGECVLLHIGKNNWIVVDSCVFPGDYYPAPLLYFDKMNIDYNSMKLIIATHWHDDHIKGIGTIFKACTNAEFVCSDALKNQEFLELIEIFGDCVISNDSGIYEFHKVVTEMVQRRENNIVPNTPKFAVADRRIWKSTFKDNNENIIMTNLYSLSPCDEAILSAKLEIKKYIPLLKEYPKSIPSISPNQTSVVLWLSFNDICILLGSDLEEKNNPNKGWSVIIDSNTRPDGKADIYKVAHHGSINAFHPGIWKELLTEHPIAVLTPFSKGKKIPDSEGIKKICSNTSNAFITGDPLAEKKIKRRPVVEKIIKEATGKIKMMSPSYGHIRIRYKSKENYSIELFGNATPLCNERQKME